MGKGRPPIIEVYVDTREQHPVTFPEFLRWDDRMWRIKVTPQTLNRAGDYCIRRIGRRNTQRLVGVERKSGIPEIVGNTSPGDIERFTKALDGLALSYTTTIMWLEGGPLDLWKPIPGMFSKPPYLKNFGIFLDLLKARDIVMTWAPGRSVSKMTRERIGTALLYLMLSHCR